MASVKSLKRKSRHEDLLEAPAAPLLSANGHGIDMASDSENDEDFVPGDEDDQDDEEFPEIDANSDSDDQGDDSDEPDEDDEDESSDATSVSDEVNIGPKAKTVISDITGRPKRVYPEIEPDYDSDSSTEEVRPCPYGLAVGWRSCPPAIFAGPKSRRGCAHALVRRYASHWLQHGRQESIPSCKRRRARQIPCDCR